MTRYGVKTADGYIRNSKTFSYGRGKEYAFTRDAGAARLYTRYADAESAARQVRGRVVEATVLFVE